MESANRVYQLGGPIEMVQSFFNVSFVRPGTGALISPGGVLRAEQGARRRGRRGRDPSGRCCTTPAPATGCRPASVADERAVDATFGRNNTVVYLVAQDADLAGGSDLDGNVDPLLVLRTCDLSSARLHRRRAGADRGADQPVLAH